MVRRSLGPASAHMRAAPNLIATITSPMSRMPGIATSLVDPPSTECPSCMRLDRIIGCLLVLSLILAIEAPPEGLSPPSSSSSSLTMLSQARVFTPIHDSTVGVVVSQLRDLETDIEWVRQGHTAGIKLHRHLQDCIASVLILYLRLSSDLVVLLLSPAIWSTIVAGIACSACFIGLHRALKVVIKLAWLLSMPVVFVHLLISTLMRQHFGLLRTLLRLLVGKKWNPILGRTEQGHFNVDQVVLGVLLFVVALFLLPTTVVFYAVVSKYSLVMKFSVWCLARAFDLYHIVLLWLARPAGSVMIITDNAAVSMMFIVYFVSREMACGQVFADASNVVFGRR